MHIFSYATEDTTLYEASESMNTGLDEILEVRKGVDDSGVNVDVSRVLVNFDLSSISQSVVDANVTASAKYYLNLYDAKPTSLATSQSLYAYPVSQSWTMGDGRSYDNPITEEGCSWFYPQGLTSGTLWGHDTMVSSSGGSWVSGSGYEGELSFNHKSSDFRMDVTDIVNKWLDSSDPLVNHGFMVKRSGSVGNLDTIIKDTYDVLVNNKKISQKY